MQIIANLIIPDYIYENGKIIKYKKLSDKQKQNVRKQCQHVSILKQQRMKRMKQHTSIDIQKLNGAFTASDLEKIRKIKEVK